jgi:hypothetical protein
MAQYRFEMHVMKQIDITLLRVVHSLALCVVLCPTVFVCLKIALGTKQNSQNGIWPPILEGEYVFHFIISA